MSKNSNRSGAPNSDSRDGRSPDRRRFIKTGAVMAGALAMAPRLPATARRPVASAPGGGATKVTVALFQRGGADAMNLYAPTGDPDYAGLRPNIGVGAPGSGNAVEGLAMDATFAMHPDMSGLHGRFTQAGSDLAVIHAVGHLPYDRSHFESQDLFETGALAGGLQDGWINRHLQATASPGDPPVRALALRAALPRSMAGAHPAFAVKSIADLAFQGSQPDVRTTLETIVDTTATGGLSAIRQNSYQGAIDAFDLIDLFAGLDPSTYMPSNGATYPNSPLGRGLAEIAQVIKADLGIEFFAVDQGGWDHHSNLVNNISNLATDYSASITAFLTDLGLLAADVVLVSMSEFGREATENGSAGTDHGVAGAMLVAGGAVQGGTVHGAWPGLSPASLQDGRFLAPTTDFRDVLLEVLEDHMGGTTAAQVFPGHTYTPVGVI